MLKKKSFSSILMEIFFRELKNICAQFECLKYSYLKDCAIHAADADVLKMYGGTKGRGREGRQRER